MGKFTLFDFLSFVLPGGTFIGVGMILLHFSYPTVSKTELFVIPFLVVSYLLGHLFSLLGLWIEKTMYCRYPLWMEYLKRNPGEANEIDKLSISKFKVKSYKNEENQLLRTESGITYDRIYAFLEINDKDSKIKTLMAQYGFFRNTTGVWLVLLLIQMANLGLNLFDLVELNRSIALNWLLSFALLTALVSSLLLVRQRKSMAMMHTYHTFLVYASQS